MVTIDHFQAHFPKLACGAIPAFCVVRTWGYCFPSLSAFHLGLPGIPVTLLLVLMWVLC